MGFFRQKLIDWGILAKPQEEKLKDQQIAWLLYNDPTKLLKVVEYNGNWAIASKIDDGFSLTEEWVFWGTGVLRFTFSMPKHIQYSCIFTHLSVAERKYKEILEHLREAYKWYLEPLHEEDYDTSVADNLLAEANKDD